MGQGHGWEGAVLKLLRGKDFETRERLGTGGETRGHH
jgi:hypothetical protein